VNEEKYKQMIGLSPSEIGVFHMIEKAGVNALWVRSITLQTKLPTGEVNKILKKLEARKLIKPIKSITFKNRRMFILYDLEPSRELTGGIWYNDQMLDESFIRDFTQLIHSIVLRKKTCTSADILRDILRQKLSVITVTTNDIQQILDLLVTEGSLDYVGSIQRRLKHCTLADAKHLAAPAPSKAGGQQKRGRGGASKGRGQPAIGANAVVHALKGILEEEALIVEDEGAEMDLDADEAKDEPHGKAEKGRSKKSDLLFSPDDVEDISVDVSKLQSELYATSNPTREYTLSKIPYTGTSHLQIPCITCPVANLCSPTNGVINPQTCVYYTTWLSS
jgi:DNA-binding MarR family transcriptional regulator